MTDERKCENCALPGTVVFPLVRDAAGFTHGSHEHCVCALQSALATATARAEELEAERVAAFRALLPECSAYPGVANICHPDVCDCLPDTRLPAVVAVARAEAEAAHAAQLATKDAEREAAVLAMREAAAKACESRASSLMQQTRDGVMRVSESNEASKCASAIRCLPTPTSALDAERERVVRWCYENAPVEGVPCRDRALVGWDLEPESVDAYLARALAAAKGGQE